MKYSVHHSMQKVGFGCSGEEMLHYKTTNKKTNSTSPTSSTATEKWTKLLVQVLDNQTVQTKQVTKGRNEQTNKQTSRASKSKNIFWTASTLGERNKSDWVDTKDSTYTKSKL